jgi:tetratricopeptide (TPR) repeat protein
MILDGRGTPIDWHVGYQPPAEAFIAALEKSATGIDTVKALTERFAASPKDAEAAFKLALKYEAAVRDTEAAEKWRDGIARDPEGKVGTMIDPTYKYRVTYTEYGEYRLAVASAGTSKGASLHAFLKKYPNSPFQTRVGRRLGTALSSSKEQATEWYEQLAAKYPDDLLVLEEYLGFLVRTKTNPERAQEIGARLLAIQRNRSPIDPFYKSLAGLNYARNDPGAAVGAYGPDVVKNRTRLMALDLTRYAVYWADRKTNAESGLWAADAALTLCPPDGAQAAIVIYAAEAYLKFGREDKALAVIGPEYAKKHWNESGPLWTYANFWTRQGLHLDEAVAAAKRMTEISPHDWNAWDALGEAYGKQKNYPLAIAAAEKAIELADEDTKGWLRNKVAGLKAEAAKAK